MYEVDRQFWLDDHYEGGSVYQDIVTFHLRRTTQGSTVRYGLASAPGANVANRLLKPHDLGDGRLRFDVPLGFKQGTVRKSKPGFRGLLQVTASRWNVA